MYKEKSYAHEDCKSKDFFAMMIIRKKDHRASIPHGDLDEYATLILVPTLFHRIMRENTPPK